MAARNAYAKTASEQGALLLDRNYAIQAEEAFRIANEISPGNSGAVFRYVSLLAEQKRFDGAIRTFENAMSVTPDNKQFRDVADNLQRQKK